MTRIRMLTAAAALALLPALGAVSGTALAADASAPSRSYKPIDLFALEYASDPQISPDGKKIAYVRRSFDIMTDRARANIWIIDVATGEHRPLLSGTASFSSPRWSPDGKRLAYISSAEGSAQIYVRWMDSGATARVTNLTQGPAGLSWSPDGRHLAFAMFVPEDAQPFASMPAAPEGARWAGKPVVIDRLNYRNDGAGYAAQGHDHIFTVPTEGGTPRQVTRGAFDHGGLIDWSNDGKTLIFSANRKDDPDRHPQRDQIFSLNLETGALMQLTKREGPSVAPQISPDGKLIAFLGYTDRYTSNQEFSLWVMNRDGSNARPLTDSMDVGVTEFGWDSRGGLYFAYDQQGTTKLAYTTPKGGTRILASGLGGEDIGRPYSGISMSIARDGTVATNVTSDTQPGDVAVIKGTSLCRLTRLNDDVAAIRDLARVEEIWTTAPDGVKSQSW
ncbi:MAG: DPP IV N-terminal domain-containing protein, partial [Sphingomonadaceae bacterium]